MAEVAYAEGGKKNHVQKPEKPDQELFDKNLKIAQDEHNAARENLNAVRTRLELIKNPGKSPHEQELRSQLSSLDATQQDKKVNRAKIEEDIKALDTTIKAKKREYDAAQAKLKYKTVEDHDAAIRKLEKDMESGKLKLVDERKTLAEISSLNKVRKNYASLSEMQKAIDADKATLDELKQLKKDPEVQELSNKYEAVKKELESIQAEQDAAHQNRSSLFDERSRLHEEQQVKWQAIQTLKNEYYSNKDAYRAYEQQARKIKQEKWIKEQKEQKQAYRREIAQRKMEEASQKAYTSEIITCEGLIGFFDPSSAEAARKAKLLAEPRALAAQPSRLVDGALLSGTKLVSKDEREEDYFVGTGGKKKGKKGKKEAASPAPDSSASAPTEPSIGGKFNLSFGILEELGKVDVETPMSRDDVPKTLEKLREKLAWYKESQETKTQENIAKAQKEIDRLAAEAAREDGEEPSAKYNPTSEVEPEAKPEEKTAKEDGATEEKAEWM